jgi:putative flippase GtrA
MDTLRRLAGGRRTEIIRFLKFAVVGTMGAVVDFGTLFLLHPTLGIPIIPANTCSFTAAVLSNFLWNRYWTYPDSRSKPIRTQLSQFFLVNIAGWAINTGILVLLRGPFVSVVGAAGQTLGALSDPGVAYDVGYNLAKATATGIVLFWNFFVNRLWTYSDVT